MDKIITALRVWNPWLVKGWELNQTNISRDLKDELLKTLNLKHIKDIIGIRRCGKTTTFYQIINELIKSKVDPSTILLINFDDIAINTADFDDVLKAIYKINPKVEYLFLDEVQEKTGWERWIRTLYDTGEFKQIFITGSNTALLSKDMGRVLTGRHVSFRLLPFSFHEFLIANGWSNFDKNYLLKERNKLAHYLENYLLNGGFPETLNKKDDEIQRILSNIFNDIIARDISERYKIESRKIEELAKYSFSNFTNEYSLRNIATTTGLNIETVSRYLTFLEEAFLVFNLNIFSYKLKTQFKQNKKIYAVDNGLRNHVSFKFSEDYGRLAENAVFIELKRRNKDIYYWKDEKSEVDFVIKNGLKLSQLVQVCWNLDDKKTEQRELKGLFAAGKTFNLKEGTIITQDYLDEKNIDNFKVKYVPLSLWLLEK